MKQLQVAEDYDEHDALFVLESSKIRKDVSFSVARFGIRYVSLRSEISLYRHMIRDSSLRSE